MNKLSLALALSILCGCCGSCNEVEKALEDPKLRNDSANVVDDLIELGEDVVEDSTGVKVNIELPKGKANEKAE